MVSILNSSILLLREHFPKPKWQSSVFHKSNHYINVTNTIEIPEYYKSITNIIRKMVLKSIFLTQIENSMFNSNWKFSHR